MNRDRYLVIKLAEEANEVAKEALKLALFGTMSGEYNNLELLAAELKDFMTVLWLLEQELDLETPLATKMCYEEKRQKLDYYQQFVLDEKQPL